MDNTGCFTREGMGNYWPKDSAELARLGDAIGANTNLQQLIICSANELTERSANNAAFFGGLNRNISISYLSLKYHGVTDYIPSDKVFHLVGHFNTSPWDLLSTYHRAFSLLIIGHNCSYR